MVVSVIWCRQPGRVYWSLLFLPGNWGAHGVGAIGGGVVKGEGAVFLDGYLCVVSDPDVVHIGAGAYCVGALGYTCLLCLIGKVDTLPEVLVDDLVGREGLWCYHVGVYELFRQGMAHPCHVGLVRGKAQDMSPGGELEEGIGRW